MDERFVIALALAEAATIAVALALLIGHAAWVEARRHRQGPRLAAASQMLAAAVEGRVPDHAGVIELAKLPRGFQIAAFAGLADTLEGGQKQRLTQIGAEVGLIAIAERWCGSRRWGQRLRGARLLTLLGGGRGVVPVLLDDPRPEVRAQAAQWAGAHPEAASLDRLLEMLSDPETLCRFTVKDALLRVGRPAIEPILRHLSLSSGTQAAEALELAAGIADSRFLQPALELSRSPHAPTRAGAATLAGAIGGSQATVALMALLRDPDADVRSAAAAALGLLRHWPAAGALAESLSDPAWTVRQAAALALRGLGAVGILLLRKALNADDAFARDMARQVLDLPGDDGFGLESVIVVPAADLLESRSPELVAA